MYLKGNKLLTVIISGWYDYSMGDFYFLFHMLQVYQIFYSKSELL